MEDEFWSQDRGFHSVVPQLNEGQREGFIDEFEQSVGEQLKSEAATVLGLLDSEVAYAVGTVLRTADGHAYMVVDSGEDFITEGGVRLVATETVRRLSSFGFVGDGSGSDTARAQTALDWLGQLGAVSRRSLIWDISEASLSGSLILPDASEWAIDFPFVTRLTQTVSNTPHFIMQISNYRYSFGFTGNVVKFLWAADQQVTDTYAIGVAIRPISDQPDGCFHFFFAGLWNENGYDLIGLHPDAASLRCPFWGYDIGGLYHQTLARGRVFNLNSGTPAGAPAGKIDRVYIKPSNAAGLVFIVRTQTGLRINSMEINDANKRCVLIESSPNVSIDMLRFEKCSMVAGNDLMSVAGEAELTIGSLHLQTLTTAAASDCYALVSFGSAVVNIAGAIKVDDCDGSGAGILYGLHSQTDGTHSGRFVLPATIRMQKTSSHVALYPKGDGGSVMFAAGHLLGPYFRSAASTFDYNLLTIGTHGGVEAVDAVAPEDGYVVALQVSLSDAITAGTLRFDVRINDVPIPGYALNVTSGSKGEYYTIYGWEPPTMNDAHKVVRGDRLRISGHATGVTGGGLVTASVLLAHRSTP